jgi:hypothetical protein
MRSRVLAHVNQVPTAVSARVLQAQSSTAKYVTFRAVHYPARGRSNACGGLVGGRGAWGTETIRGMLEMALVK